MPRAAAVDPRGLLVRLRFGGAHLPQPSWFADASVEAEEGDPASTLSLYRRALALRHELRRSDWSGSRPAVTVFGSAPLALSRAGSACRAVCRVDDDVPGETTGMRGLIRPVALPGMRGRARADPIDAFNGSVASTENDKLSR
jgi:alpha-glucosidase